MDALSLLLRFAGITLMLYLFAGAAFLLPGQSLAGVMTVRVLRLGGIALAALGAGLGTYFHMSGSPAGDPWVVAFLVSTMVVFAVAAYLERGRAIPRLKLWQIPIASFFSFYIIAVLAITDHFGRPLFFDRHRSEAGWISAIENPVVFLLALLVVGVIVRGFLFSALQSYQDRLARELSHERPR